MRYQGEADYQHGAAEAAGVLLVNLGTPDEPTAPALRRYLAEFLWDPRVVEIPRPLWWLILHGIVLRTRPARSAAKYQTVWTGEGSPLLTFGRKQATGVQDRLTGSCPGPVVVALAMRYGNPSIPGALAALRDAGVRRLLVLPLYPQYSAATTASTFDRLSRELRTWRWIPELRMVNQYHDDPGYIGALAASIREAWQDQPPGERLLLSFHGLPKRNLLAGDPYHCQCHKTARLVAQALGLADDAWAVAFQSRFGRAEWLKPYTSELLEEWARSGVGSVDVVCPGFSADCLETLEEIAVENRETFLGAGGGRYRYLPALNDRTDHLDLLSALIRRHGAGWPEFDHGERRPDDAQLQAGRARALKLGAPR